MTPQSAAVLICALARMLEGVRHVAVGAASPLPGAAALLARARSGGATRATLIHGTADNPFTDGGRELFDCAGQGRIDAFFLGGGQIDGQANVNLVGVGDYPRTEVRFPGSFGSAYLYFVVPRVILFREEHSRRVLVPKVDFVSAPGLGPPDVHRPGGPVALVTGKAVMEFQKDRGRFRLDSIHPGHTVAEVLDATGFGMDVPEVVPQTRVPNEEDLVLLHGRVREELARTYPAFAARYLVPG